MPFFVPSIPPHRNRRSLAAAGWLLAALAGLPQAAQAQYATGGAGRFLPNILWFDWGASGSNIPQTGTSVTNTFNVSGQELKVRCELSNISGGTAPSLRVYRPGGWRGDGLDDLYNIGGTGAANTMNIGLRNRVDATTVRFNFSCSATIGLPGQPAQPYPLDGLVVADAEQSDNNEYLQATMSRTNGTLSTTWRIIDRFRNAGCASSTPATLTQTAATSTLRLGAPATGCSAGPMGVAFMENAASAQVEFRGGGGSAVALGVFLIDAADRSDAPASYGEAVHLSQFSWSGGTLNAGAATNIHDSAFTLASLVPPSTRLGGALDSEANTPFSADADGDDRVGTPNDEDALAAPLGTVLALPGQAYVSPAIACTGPGTVRGWIDFNRDGDFGDPGEVSSNSPACTGSTSVNLNWTVPSGVQPGKSFMRLRIASNAAQVAAPTGTANDGEVEDHVLTLANARVVLVKQVGARAAAADQFTVSVLQGASVLGTASTTGSGTSASTPAVALASGSAYLLRDALSTGSTPFDRYEKTLACVANTGSTGTVPTPGGPTGAGPVDWTLTPNAGNDLTCTVLNRARVVRLSITKDDGQTAYTPGQPRTYRIQVRNDGPDAVIGALVSDMLPNGVRLSGPWQCQPSSGGVCTPASGGNAGDAAVNLSVDLPNGGSAQIDVPVVYSANPGDY